MPTRWMRWNETTHVFEYSTDGVGFGALPLHASTITEGVFDPARIPDVGGGGIDPTLPVIWTGQQTLSGVAPSLRFTETDQAADLKSWDVQADSQILRFRALTDAFVATELLTLTRAGVLTIKATGAPTHAFTANNNGGNVLQMSNTNAGSSAWAGIEFANNAGPARGYLWLASSSYIGTPDALILDGVGVGGLILTSSTSQIRFQTAGITRMTISAAGAITFQGAVSFTDLTLTGNLTVANIIASGTIKERGRTIAIGDWTAIPFSAANFTASSGNWTVALAGQVTLAYIIIGKTITLTFYIDGVTSASTAETRIALPAGIVPTRTMQSSILGIDAGQTVGAVCYVTAGVSYLTCRKYTTSLGSWQASGVNGVRGQISFEFN